MTFIFLFVVIVFLVIWSMLHPAPRRDDHEQGEPFDWESRRDPEEYTEFREVTQRENARLLAILAEFTEANDQATRDFDQRHGKPRKLLPPELRRLTKRDP
jgi:Na+-transporting methylmalonyl-CoA/oxaloacetate decarboxylase gamma subunit